MYGAARFFGGLCHRAAVTVSVSVSVSISVSVVAHCVLCVVCVFWSVVRGVVVVVVVTARGAAVTVATAVTVTAAFAAVLVVVVVTGTVLAAAGTVTIPVPVPAVAVAVTVAVAVAVRIPASGPSHGAGAAAAGWVPGVVQQFAVRFINARHAPAAPDALLPLLPGELLARDVLAALRALTAGAFVVFFVPLHRFFAARNAFVTATKLFSDNGFHTRLAAAAAPFFHLFTREVVHRQSFVASAAFAKVASRESVPVSVPVPAKVAAKVTVAAAVAATVAVTITVTVTAVAVAVTVTVTVAVATVTRRRHVTSGAPRLHRGSTHRRSGARAAHAVFFRALPLCGGKLAAAKLTVALHAHAVVRGGATTTRRAPQQTRW